MNKILPEKFSCWKIRWLAAYKKQNHRYKTENRSLVMKWSNEYGPFILVPYCSSIHSNNQNSSYNTGLDIFDIISEKNWSISSNDPDRFILLCSLESNGSPTKILQGSISYTQKS